MQQATSNFIPIPTGVQLQPQQQQRYRYQNEIQAMMYTFGDVRHPLSATTLLVEDIVHNQMIQLLVRVSGIVSRRGTRTIAPEDLLFLLRHDINRSTRLKEFLSWKDVRKNAKATGGGGELGATEGSAVSTGGGNTDDSALVAEIEEDAKTLAAAAASDVNFEGGSGDSRSAADNLTVDGTRLKPSAVQIGPKRRQLGLFWDLGHGLLADLPGGIVSSGSTSAFTDGTSLTSYDSRDQATFQRETLRRLRHADLLTLSMSQTEYMEYSECRQASFTYKKARKFREWLVGGTSRPASLTLSNLAGGSARDLARLNDDTLEILGFLAYEIVQKLTEVSLAVKYEREMLMVNSNVNSTTSTPSLGGIFTSSNTANNNNNNSNISNNSNSSVKPSPAISSTTVTSSNPSSTAHTHVKTPIQVNHVEEAYRKLIAGNLDSDNLFHHGSNRKRKFIL